MTGAALLGLLLLSMGWLFFLAGLAINIGALRKSPKAKAGARSLNVAPGVVGSITVFYTIPALAGYGIEVPWPWWWILLPLALDAVLLALRNRIRRSP